MKTIFLYLSIIFYIVSISGLYKTGIVLKLDGRADHIPDEVVMQVFVSCLVVFISLSGWYVKLLLDKSKKE